MRSARKRMVPDVSVACPVDRVEERGLGPAPFRADDRAHDVRRGPTVRKMPGEPR